MSASIAEPVTGPFTDPVPLPAEKSSAPTPTLYDADAEQTIQTKTTVRRRGLAAQIPVTHRLAALDDELFIEYDKRRDVRFASVAGGTDTKSNATEAAAWLYRQLDQGHEPGQLTLTDAHMAGVVLAGLLACAVVEPETLTVEEAIKQGLFDEEADDSAPTTIRLRCLFNSREVVTEHDLQPASAEQQTRFHRLMGRARLVDGDRLGQRETKMPSRARALGKLYDERVAATRGYAGRVPLHHKIEIVVADMTAEQEVAGEA